MDSPRVTVATKYGTLDVGIAAGPTSAPGHGYLGDHVYPSEAHAFGREADAPYLYAFVRSEDGQLTINGIPYTVTYARYSLTEGRPGYRETPGVDWREEYGSGPALKRSDVMFGGEPTDAARKAWTDTISPAIVAALRSATSEAREAQMDALQKYAGSLRETADRLRAEAARLDGMAAAAFDAYTALVQAAPMA